MLIALITGGYTILGGLKAVVFTDVVQSVLLLAAGLMVLHLFYWSTNQYVVQRTLAARSERAARAASSLSGF